MIQRDSFGNALGGIRMPQQEVPTGRNTPSFACVVSLPGSPAKTALATFPQWDAFNGGVDPAVDPTDTVNAIEPASARAVYGSGCGLDDIESSSPSGVPTAVLQP